MKLTLNDDLLCKNLIINESFDSNEHTIQCNVMLIEISASSTIDISNSTITACMVKINDTNEYILPDSDFSGDLHVSNVYHDYGGSSGTSGSGRSGTSSISINCSGSNIFNSVTIESPLTYITGTLYTDQFYSDGVGDNNVLTGTEVDPTPVPSEPIFLLNFEGEEGSTTWIEEIQGLEPKYDYSYYWYIDTSKHYSGTSCLRLDSGGEVDYIVPNIGSDFSICTYMYIDSDIDSDIDIMYLFDQDGAAECEIYLTYYDSVRETASIGAYGRDNNTDMFNPFDDVSLPVNTWNKFECIVSGSQLIVKINDSVFTTYTSSINNPFLGIDYFYFYNGSSYSVWFDEIGIESTTTTSTPTTSSWYIVSNDESINISNTSLSSSNASGSSTFYSFVVDGCFDGGDNTGWVFDGMRYTFTNVQENHTLDVTFASLPIYDITINIVEGEGTIEPSGSVIQVELGKSQSFDFYPGEGYNYCNLIVDGITYSRQDYYNFVAVSKNHTIDVYFRIGGGYV